VIYSLCTTVVVRSATLVRTQANLCTTTPKDHAADKRNTPTSHITLTPGQPVLLETLNGER